MEQEAKHTVIEVRELSAIFPNSNGGLKALDRVSFSVNSQEFVCFLGPSGSGKSTLLRILAGLLPATHGEVFFMGDLVDKPRGEIGFVFQDANLMPWRSVLENITLPLELAGWKKKDAKGKAQEMVELVGLSGFENILPGDLSGGMAQRVAIARALIHDPEVLLLDEPFGALDAITRERMGSELLRIWHAKKKTVVMVTHSISEALYLADRVFVLSQRPGRIYFKLEVSFARPRQETVRYTAKFGKMAQQVRDSIGNV
jgi:NitT/TauT family transport system ATP-binding protein